MSNEYLITTVSPSAEHPVKVHPPVGDGWDVLQMTQGTFDAGRPLITLLWVRRVDT